MVNNKFTQIPRHIIIFALITTISLTIFIGPQLLLLLGGWYILIFITLIAINYSSPSATAKKNETLKEHIILLAYLYPIQEFIIKIFITRNLIPFSYWWLNRIEHALFSISITFLIFIIVSALLGNTKHDNTQKHKHINLVIISGITLTLVNLLGMFNEILEYIIRYLTQPTLSIYHVDTLNDMITNLIASIIAVFLTHLYLQWHRS